MSKTEDPVVQMATLLGKYHYFMAKEIIDAVGYEKGSKIVLSAIEKYANDRLEEMREVAKERGLPLDIITYRKVRDMPDNGWVRNPENRAQIFGCPFNDAWSKFGEEGRKIGYLYCSIDHTLYKGWGAELDRPECLAAGDKSCDFRTKAD